MLVKKERVIDESYDDEGNLEYRYEDDCYRFEFDSMKFSASSSVSENDLVSIAALQVNDSIAFFDGSYLATSEFREAYEYLINEGKTRFQVLFEDGYILYPQDQSVSLFSKLVNIFSGKSH